MKHVKIYIVAAIFSVMLIYIIFNVTIHNKKVNKVNLQTFESDKVEIENISLEELRKVYGQNIEDIRNGEYDNLSTKNPVIHITEADEIYEMRETSGEWYKDMDLLEIVNQEGDVMKALIGNDIDMNQVIDETSWYYINYVDEYDHDIAYFNYDETVENIKNGTYTPNEIYKDYCTYPCLQYYVDDSQDLEDSGQVIPKYCYVPCDLDYVVFWKGKTYEVMGEVVDDFEDVFAKPDAIYYKDGEELEDEYQLSNGKISVGDAIDFVEEYFANLYPYNRNEEILQVVDNVKVFDIGNGLYAFQIGISREYKGLVADWGTTAGDMTSEVMTYDKDTAKVIMMETDDVDVRTGTGNGNEMECVGEPITKIVSLESAFRLIAGNIGTNSKYEIEEISMVYRRKVVNNTVYQSEYTGIPSWKITCRNIADGKKTRFYINLKDGSLEYYVD